MAMWSAPLALREIQIKMALSFLVTSFKMPKVKKTTVNSGEKFQIKDHLHMNNDNVIIMVNLSIYHGHLWGSFFFFFSKLNPRLPSEAATALLDIYPEESNLASA